MDPVANRQSDGDGHGATRVVGDASTERGSAKSFGGCAASFGSSNGRAGDDTRGIVQIAPGSVGSGVRKGARAPMPGHEIAERARKAPAARGPESTDQIRRTGGVRFLLVDSLRAIAALSVLLYHVGGVASPPHVIAIFTNRLSVGVTLFFVISGFLLYRPFVAARFIRGRRALGTGRYAWHRFLRIVPAYWVALTVISLWLGDHDVFGPDAIVYYGFGQVYAIRTILGGVGQAWTLSIEVAFYVFLPFWAWAIARIPARTANRRVRIELIALAMLATFSIVYKPVIQGWTGLDPGLGFALNHALPRYLDQFAIGMALAVASVWFETHRTPVAVKAIEHRPWIPWGVAAVALTVLAVGFSQNTDEFSAVGVHYLNAVIALGLFLPAVFGTARRSLVLRFLGHPVLIWIGVVSYGLFLWHMAVVIQVSRWGGLGSGLIGLFAWLAVCIGPALALAAASWYGVERTALRYKSSSPPLWLKRFVRIGGARGAHGARLAAYGLGAIVAWVVVSNAINPPIGGTAAAARAFPSGRGWVYVVATYDSRTLRLYQNGRLIASAPATGEPGPTSASIEVGNYIGTARWTGPLKYVAIYQTPLTSQQIHSHYDAGLASWLSFDAALRVSPMPTYLWRDRFAAFGSPDPAYPPPSPYFSLEAWLKAGKIDNRVVVYLPHAWYLQTDVFGRLLVGLLVHGKQFTATSTLVLPHSALTG
jgi:peptidoglycan/LPS O-acetylase OafA/YrhL